MHLILGSLLQRVSCGKIWLFLLPAFLSHAYIDYFTNLVEPESINWFGLRADITQDGSLVSWTGFEGLWELDNFGLILIIAASITVWLFFFRRYWLGAMCAWGLWDSLWVIQQLAYRLGFSPPLMHDTMLYYLMTRPVVFGVHTVLFIGLLFILRQRFPVLFPVPAPLSRRWHNLNTLRRFYYRRAVRLVRRKTQAGTVED